MTEPWLEILDHGNARPGQRPGRKAHELTIEKQGEFHYVYGPYAKPVLTIEPGDIVVVETEDAFGGVITARRTARPRSCSFRSSTRNAARSPSRGARRAIAGRPHPCREAARRAAGRHHLR